MDDESMGPLPGDISHGDIAVLEQLKERGDDLSQPRRTLLFFYRGGEEDRSAADLFDPIAEAGREAGLTVSVSEENELILEGNLLVHPQALEMLLDWARQWAEHTGAEFDGWECVLAEHA